MTLLVSLDTETGVVRRWNGRDNTHVAGLVTDPEDGEKTFATIQSFREDPPWKLRVPEKRARTYDDAVREQRDRRERS